MAVFAIVLAVVVVIVLLASSTLALQLVTTVIVVVTIVTLVFTVVVIVIIVLLALAIFTLQVVATVVVIIAIIPLVFAVFDARLRHHAAGATARHQSATYPGGQQGDRLASGRPIEQSRPSVKLSSLHCRPSSAYGALAGPCLRVYRRAAGMRSPLRVAPHPRDCLRGRPVTVRLGCSL
jgi:hypothetical protein